MDKKTWIDNILGKLTIEQKVGQLMVFGFCGPVITPDVVEYIRKYHIGGLRITQGCRIITMAHAVRMGDEPEPWIKRATYYPTGKNRDYAFLDRPTRCTANEYAAVLNQLRRISMERDSSVPLHYTIDQEGNISEMLSGQRLFPDPLGLTWSDDPLLAYQVGKCIGLQARALGVNMIHSPTVDVNVNPRNPEIGPRGYSSDPQIVTEYAAMTLKGLLETKMIPTAKHFPGRGDSEVDSHFELPIVGASKEAMYRLHLYPYKKLIEAGLPAVMIGHSIYPSIDSSHEPSSCSQAIINGILREEFGFDGVITTDNMMMAGLMKRYEITTATIKAIKAGCDLILLRDESPLRLKVLNEVINAVKSKEISEVRIDESVKRILCMRWDMGLAENGGLVDPAKAAEPIADKFVVDTAKRAAGKCTAILRDDDGLVPIPENKKILLIEQVHTIHSEANNMYSHPGLLWEQMCKFSDNVISVEIPFFPSPYDRERILRRLDEADIIVMTNYYHPKKSEAITPMVREIMSYGKAVVVLTNNPYEFGAPKDFPTVVVTFCPGGMENLEAAAKMILGRIQSTAKIKL